MSRPHHKPPANFLPRVAPALLRPEPRFTLWRPSENDPQDLRYWQSPRMGDIVSCRFPDFLRGALDIQTSVKIRPCMIVGAEEFLSGQVIVKVAYGTSRTMDRADTGSLSGRHSGARPDSSCDSRDGIQPGELLVRAGDAKTGLQADTKFCLRKMIELPFSSEHFPPDEGVRFGIYPKRGRVNLEEPVMDRALKIAIAEVKLLGSALESIDGQHYIKRDVRSGHCIR